MGPTHHLVPNVRFYEVKSTVRVKSFFEPSSSIIQNVFALIPIISMQNEKRHNKIHTSVKKVGIELIAKRTDAFLKTTSGPALAR